VSIISLNNPISPAFYDFFGFPLRDHPDAPLLHLSRLEGLE